jgi:hypothetical protein
MSIDRIHDTDGPATILLTGLIGDLAYEATIRTLDLDMLAEVARQSQGRTARQGAVSVKILSRQALGASHA